MKVQDKQQLVGRPVIDCVGRRLGVVRHVMCAAGDPYEADWAVVTLGPWHARSRLVPIDAAVQQQAGIRLAHPREVVVSAPRPQGGDGASVDRARVYYAGHHR